MKSRRTRYREIADTLRDRVRSAAPGSLLPSEAELSAEFEASRVTVRRALEELRAAGVLSSRQGLGWFVSAEPVIQQLERLETIEDQLADSGRRGERHVVEFGFIESPERVREQLGVGEVLRVKRINLADGEPFAVVTVWCPAPLGRSLSRDDVERQPFYELLAVELRGATQTIGAATAEGDDAELLNIPVGAPTLTCRRVTTDRSGQPVLLSDHVYPAHRTEFVVDLPNAAPSTMPSGFRLVADDQLDAQDDGQDDARHDDPVEGKSA